MHPEFAHQKTCAKAVKIFSYYTPKPERKCYTKTQYKSLWGQEKKHWFPTQSHGTTQLIMRTVFIKHFVNNEWLLLLWPKIPSIVLSQKGIEPSDKMLVNLFVYLFNTKCRIANTVQSDIAIIQLATCNTATVRLFVDYKLKCVLVRVVFNPISSSSSIR